MKKVLLFSGGFDSMLLEWVVKPDILLYVNVGSSYAEKELEFIRGLPEYYKDRLLIKNLPLGDFEHDDKFIPYRNLMLASVAFNYGTDVYFGFTCQDGDDTDCSEEFIYRAEGVFNFLSTEVNRHFEQERTRIWAPFIRKTKTQMVELALRKGMPKEVIQNIRTCYSDSSTKGCGVCYPCWNKAVALINNNIFRDDLFDEPIEESKFYISMSNYEKKWGSQAEDIGHYKEVKSALRKLQSLRK